MYVVVYIIRKPECKDAKVLDYTIPKDKMIVVSSAMELGDDGGWANRFLTFELQHLPVFFRLSSRQEPLYAEQPSKHTFFGCYIQS